MKDIGHLRREYNLNRIDITKIEQDPFALFDNWFKEALVIEDIEANSMILSTVNYNNKPSSRVVLLKEYSNCRFKFYTNYLSKKGKHIEDNAYVALLFYWPKSVRQIRIEGYAQKTSITESNNYFSQRPRESMASAIISKQSQKMEISMNSLMTEYNNLLNSNKPLNRPKHWGGYDVIPEYFEFWQGNKGRLHDRFQFTKEDNSTLWQIDQLYP